ncbi:guanylate-binding protein 2-like [Branchiostoma lanceolatum]|uniref:guanylate-binding protein 2-like n=1 Tax=Branchiostoma lanceolatum TaxID=7740 RepID=UPI0034562663
MPRRDVKMSSACRKVLFFCLVFCAATVSALHKEFSEKFVDEGVHGPPVVRPVPSEPKSGPPHSTQHVKFQPQNSPNNPTTSSSKHTEKLEEQAEVKREVKAEVLKHNTQHVQPEVHKPTPPNKVVKQVEKVDKKVEFEGEENQEVLDHWHDFPEQPLQLVMPDVTHKKLVVVQKNAKLLHRISGAVATIAVVGKFHSGKSFLMNQLMGKSSGFGVGPYVRPHTMGIWMWGKPMEMTLPSGDKVSVIFLDTEGFAANNISENYDAKIFAVSTLLSSYLIYNSVKIIDQADIDYLELLARRTQLFALRSQMSRSKWADDFNHDLLSFPPLLWYIELFNLFQVVQDFAQLLGDNDSPQEWLRKLMDTSAWDNEDYEISLLGVFKSVDCHTLFLPATRRELLQDLSQAREEDLTEEYREERDSLITKLRKGLVPKEKNDNPITGAELASLLDILVNAANEGSLAQIPSRWNVFIDKLERTAKEDCLLFYEGEMAVLYKGRDNGPIIPQELEDWHNQMYNKSLNLLQHLLFGLGDSVEMSSLDLGREIRSKFDKTLEMNDKKIKLRCTEWQRRLEVGQVSCGTICTIVQIKRLELDNCYNDNRHIESPLTFSCQVTCTCRSEISSATSPRTPSS